MKSVLVFGAYPNFQAVLARMFRKIPDVEVVYEREIADLPGRFRERQPDLVLYETNPKIEKANQLKVLVELTTGQQTPIIATGTSSDADFIKGLLKDGVLFYLHRPFSEAVFRMYVYDGLRSQLELVRVVREIEFKPEQKQAGIAILAYFSRILESKYPGDRYAVAITQDEGKVTLEVQALDGTTERIEAALHAYGLVVHEQKPAEELFTDELEVLALKNKLEMAALEVRQARELHRALASNNEKRIGHLEEEVAALRRFLGDSLSLKRDEQRELIAFFTQVTTAGSAELRVALGVLANKMHRGLDAADEGPTKDALARAEQERPGFLAQLHEVFIKGSISGASGNYLYSWLVALVSSLPK